MTLTLPIAEIQPEIEEVAPSWALVLVACATSCQDTHAIDETGPRSFVCTPRDPALPSVHVEDAGDRVELWTRVGGAAELSCLSPERRARTVKSGRVVTEADEVLVRVTLPGRAHPLVVAYLVPVMTDDAARLLARARALNDVLAAAV